MAVSPAVTPAVTSLRLRPLVFLLACAFSATAPAQQVQAAPDTVLVTGQRLDESGTVTTLDADALARQGATDMQNIARYAPLVSVPGAASGSGNVWDGAGNTGFNIRGVEGNRVALDLDGIALPEAAPKPDASTTNAFGVGRDYFDPETFRSVRIGSGSTAAGAGSSGLGGSVAFVTKAPDDYVSAAHPLYAEYKIGYNGADGMRMHALTGAARSGALRMLALVVHRDGHEPEAKGAAATNPDDWDSDALLAKLSWSPAAGHTLHATLDAFHADHARAYDNKQGASYPDGALQDARTRRHRASIEHRYDGATPWFDSLSTRIHVQDAEIEDTTHARYITGGQPYIRNIVTSYENRSSGIASDATLRIGAHELAYGLSAEEVSTKRPWREDRTVIASGAQQVTLKNRMPDMESRNLSAYARAELALSSAWSLTPGLRYHYREMKPDSLADYAVALPNAGREIVKETDSYVTPSATLRWQLRPALQAYLQYSRGTRLPTAAERTGTYDSFSYSGAGNGYAVLGNPDLKKETSNAWELGAKGSVARGLHLHAALFQTRYANFIEYAAQPPDPVNYPTVTFGLYRPENVGQARTWGGELSAELDAGKWSAPLAGVTLTAAAGIGRSKARNTLSGVEGELASTLPKKGSVILAWDDPAKRGGAAFAVVHTAAKQAAPDVIAGVSTPRFAVPSATVMDLTAYWNLGRNVSFGGGVYNLADRKYWDYASSRSLPLGTTAAGAADIARQARPGRYVAAHFKLMY